MCPRYILSDNDMEFKNNLMDQVLQQLGIDRIFFSPIPPTEQWQAGSFTQIFKTHPKETL